MTTSENSDGCGNGILIYVYLYETALYNEKWRFMKTSFTLLVDIKHPDIYIAFDLIVVCIFYAFIFIYPKGTPWIDNSQSRIRNRYIFIVLFVIF